MVDRPTSDRPFFHEWENREPGSKRSLSRVLALQKILGIEANLPVPTVAIVGSKGKGSTAAALSVFLGESGLKVGAITSPPYRSNRERIRIHDQVIDEADYSALGNRLKIATETLPTQSGTYLSPSGAFMSMGIRYFLDNSVDVILVEEGMGGLSDEISLFEYDVVIATPIFLEHVGKIGHTEAEIAKDLLGIVSRRTKHLISAVQSIEVERQLKEKYSLFGVSRDFPNSNRLSEDAQIPPALRNNFNLAARAASILLEENFQNRPLKMRDNINIPGRYFFVNNEMTNRKQWFIDASNNPEALRMTLDFLESKDFKPTQAYVCFSNERNRTLGLEMLRGVTTYEVRIDNAQSRVFVDEANAISIEQALGQARLNDNLSIFIGNIWYVSNILEAVEANLDKW